MEGLGTPGAHPYLIGRSEGYGMLDAVRAARRLDKRLGRRVILAGHSQGGHAALWGASLARKRTPELKLRGTLALAPASHIGEQAALLRSLTAPSPISGLASMILRGIDVGFPDLGVAAGLSAPAAALYPQTLTKCLGYLASANSFGALAPAQLIRPEVDIRDVVSALNAQDPDELTIRGSLRIQQGEADTTVFKTFTDQLVAGYSAAAVDLVYKTYPGVNHGGAVTDAKSAGDATSYIRSRLR
jgi:pimeloyl-ACP methyl ester carboxylesterase